MLSDVDVAVVAIAGAACLKMKGIACAPEIGTNETHIHENFMRNLKQNKPDDDRSV